MKGLKVRVPETDLMISTMDALGASATAIAYSELYTSLQSGVVDAAENGVTSYMSNSFNEGCPLLHHRCTHLWLRRHPDER